MKNSNRRNSFRVLDNPLKLKRTDARNGDVFDPSQPTYHSDPALLYAGAKSAFENATMEQRSITKKRRRYFDKYINTLEYTEVSPKEQQSRQIIYEAMVEDYRGLQKQKELIQISMDTMSDLINQGSDKL